MIGSRTWRVALLCVSACGGPRTDPATVDGSAGSSGSGDSSPAGTDATVWVDVPLTPDVIDAEVAPDAPRPDVGVDAAVDAWAEVLDVGVGDVVRDAARDAADAGDAAAVPPILIERTGSTSTDIFAIEPDGSGVRPLVATSAHEGLARWSPDGTRIAFRRWSSGVPYPMGSVIVARADGSGEQEVYPAVACLRESLAWSRDGADLYFGCWSGCSGAPIRRLRLADRSVADVVTGGENADPDVSPDGRSLAFERQSSPCWSPTSDIFVAPLSNLVAAARPFADPDTSVDQQPRWSPSGTRLAWCHVVAVGGYDAAMTEIYVIGADGTGRTRLTTNTSSDDGPVWSPAGDRIAWSARRAAHQQVMVMNADGTDAHAITDGNQDDRVTDWRWQP